MGDMAMVPCIVCGAELENVERDANNQPYEGTAFYTHGHYGSTAFDQLNGSMLEINICDKCLKEKGKAGHVLWRREANALVDRKGAIFGWIENPDTPYVQWNPDLDEVNDIYDEKNQDGLVRIPVDSYADLLSLIKTYGIRTNGKIKLNGGFTPENLKWLDDPNYLS